MKLTDIVDITITASTHKIGSAELDGRAFISNGRWVYLREDDELVYEDGTLFDYPETKQGVKILNSLSEIEAFVKVSE